MPLNPQPQRTWLPVSILITGLMVLGIATLWFEASPAYSQGSSADVTGWVWSDSVGWISLSCLDLDSCDDVDYGVVLQSGTNLLTGWAWGDGVGWIKFGGLSSFPSGSGTTAGNATLQANGSITGWVRACAGTQSGTCSSMTSRTDGWDGWIALSGTGYSVTDVPNTNYNGNFAWGENGTGWTSFNVQFPSCEPLEPVCIVGAQGQQMSSSTNEYCQNITVDPCSYGCSEGVCNPGTGDPGWVSTDPDTILAQKTVRKDTTATLSYYVPNVRDCTLSGSNGDSWYMFVGNGTVQGSKTTRPITGRVEYTLTCRKPGGAAWVSQNNRATFLLNPQFREI